MSRRNIISLSKQMLMCYYNSKAADRPAMGKFSVSDIDPDKCTHLIFAFSDIIENELVPTTVNDVQQYFVFNALKQRNPLLRTMLAVGGEKFTTEKFRTMAGSQENRELFIKSVIKLLRPLKFDGLNLDWRYPTEEDKQRFTELCKELKTAFVDEGTSSNQKRLILAASVSAERSTIDASYEVEEIAMHLDFINVLTFDFHGPWESVTAHHSPLFQGSQDTGDSIYSNTASALEYWRDQGAPEEKLNMGISAYGRAFSLSSNSSAVGAPASGPGEEGCYTGEEGFWASYETCLYLDGVQTHLISDQKVPYATTENQWVGFDDTTSISTKINYLKANNFGGAFVWSLDLDDLSGQFCNQGKFPFVSQLHNLLGQDKLTRYMPVFLSGFPESTTTSPPNTTLAPPTVSTAPPTLNKAPPAKTTTTLLSQTSAPPTTHKTLPTTTISPPTTTTTTPPTTTTIRPTTTATPPTTAQLRLKKPQLPIQ
uniref:Chitinase-3-like protein 2 n=1 Tax=Labrus bergylta TaxID=56723 RepID=A0A3Q3ESA1_9LABR